MCSTRVAIACLLLATSRAFVVRPVYRASLRPLASSSGMGDGVDAAFAASSFTPPALTEQDIIMPEGSANPCVIKVLGVGGGGGNAVNRMVRRRRGRVAACNGSSGPAPSTEYFV